MTISSMPTRGCRLRGGLLRLNVNNGELDAAVRRHCRDLRTRHTHSAACGGCSASSDQSTCNREPLLDMSFPHCGETPRKRINDDRLVRHLWHDSYVWRSGSTLQKFSRKRPPSTYPGRLTHTRRDSVDRRYRIQPRLDSVDEAMEETRTRRVKSKPRSSIHF